MYFDGLTVEWKMSKAKTFLEASHSYTVKWGTAMENVLERKYPVPHVLARRKEGRKERRKEGKKEGKRLGRKEGRKEVRKEGRCF